MDTTLSDSPPSIRATASPGASPPVVVELATKRSFSLMDGIKLVAGLVSVVKGAAPVMRFARAASPGALALLGIRKRRGPLAKLAIFGLGLVVGVGAGLLFTPANGFDLRRKLVIGTKKKHRRNRDPERKMASWISERTAAIHDEVPPPPRPVPRPSPKVDPLADTLRDASKAASRVGAAPPDHEHAAVAGTEAAVPARGTPPGTPGYRFS